jgi:hypothetical protein
MPLVLTPNGLSDNVLHELVRSLRENLREVEALVEHPRGAVRDPASLVTALDLVRSTLSLLDRPGTPDRDRLAADANLAYATMLAAIDIVKSHTEVPRVPVPSSPANPPSNR